MIDTSKQYTYNGKPVRIYADDHRNFNGLIHGAYQSGGQWSIMGFTTSDLVEVWEPKEEKISMAKEDLLKVLKDESWDEIEFTFNHFFSQNVVIPRGENRHPDADVWHELVEDMSKELQYQDEDDDKWYKSAFMNTDHNVPLRIKPSEPAYEWQWIDPEYVQSSFDTSYIRARILSNGDYLTEAEANSLTCYGNIYKIEETKRVRQ